MEGLFGTRPRYRLFREKVLEVDYEGLHPTTLVTFRSRLACRLAWELAREPAAAA